MVLRQHEQVPVSVGGPDSNGAKAEETSYRIRPVPYCTAITKFNE